MKAASRPDATAAPPPRAAPRRRAAALAGLGLAGLALLALLRPRGDRPAPAPAPGAPPPAEAPAALAQAARPAPPPSGPAGRPGAPPVIDAIELEKDEVCSGEENLVTIRAHTPNGTDPFLHYAVAGSTGAQVPVRVWRKPDGTYDLPEVSVFGRNNVATRAPMPAFRVKDCEPPRALHVQSRALPNAPGEFEFFARVVEVAVKNAPGAPRPAPRSYRWSFGDGGGETTDKPLVAHSYRGRPQASLYSQLLVSVEARFADGERLVGRASFELLNTAFEDFDTKRIVSISAAPEPRFPDVSRDGVVRQSFRLTHQRPTPVRITRVRAVRHFNHPDEPPPPETDAVDGALGLTEIPPGEGTTVSLALDARREPDVFSVTYQLEGVSPEGYAVRGSFSLMRPPPPPTKDAHTPVDDPKLLAKIKRARAILRQEFVTDEDIWRLEREGKFADLGEAAPAAPEGAEP